jgi:predicted phosphodiesterase
MSIQLRGDRTVFTILVGFILVCLVPASCLLGGYGLLTLLPQATPAMSLVESVRATATAEALEIAAQPTPTGTSTSSPQPTATDTPYPTLDPPATDTPLSTVPTVQLVAIDTPLPTPTPQPRATNTPLPTPTGTPEPPVTPPPSTSLTRGPYLQWVRPHSIIIAWETAQEVDSVVEYGPTQAYGSKASDYTWTTRHAVTLTGLNPYTIYHYRVGTSGQVLSGDSTFKTAAGPSQTSFTFAVLADTHAGYNPDEPRRRRIIDDHHRGAMDRIAAFNPDFYLHAGDLVQDGRDRDVWDGFFAIEGDLMRRVTVFSALGNHEKNHQSYFDVFYLPHNERWYSFDYGNAHFICLELDGYGDISPGSEQYLWLQNDLANTDKTWKFVFSHFPLYSCGYEGADLGARAALHPLFVQHGVDVVFHGHDHLYERFTVDGVTYIVTGGGGGGPFDFVGCDVGPEYWEAVMHVVTVSVSGNTLNSVAIRVPEGSEFDPFTVTTD